VSDIRTVTLELLRHGPPHNQLLSPLTQYLALCGNHSAVTVHLPFEHSQMLMRLNALRYRDSPETWRLQLQDTAKALADVLSEIPGLIADLSDASGSAPKLTHLRLILSASELALVPFELAGAPAGFPGAGQPLLLQAHAPLCITREVRRVGGPPFKWPTQPNILFAAAAPPGLPPVPLEAHLLALRSAVDPWIQKDVSGRLKRSELEKNLVILPQASVDSIHAACRHTDFTHVHILAHGGRLPDREEYYGLVLHKDGAVDEQDVVEGLRLAKVLRTYREGGSNVLQCPAVTTIAACEGANQGSVVGIGASIAHAIHEAGVPLVVASQFPLSYPASVILTEVLYRGLLWGQDPRTLLNDLRWQLKMKLPGTHDWASIVAYSSVPGDFSDQLLSTRVDQAYYQFQNAVLHLERLTNPIVEAKSASRTRNTASPKASEPSARERITKRALRVIRMARQQIAQLLGDIPPENTEVRARVYSYLALAYKWQARAHFSYPYRASTSESNRAKVEDYLRKARRYYRSSFQTCASEIYPIVQELSLAAVLDGSDVCQEEWWQEKWATARTLGEAAVRRPSLNTEDRLEAISTREDLIELYLLSQLSSDDEESPCLLNLAYDHARWFVDQTNDFPTPRENAIRQFTHYTDWFNKFNPSLSVLDDPAREIIDILSNDL
jgi:CHAT domain